MWLTALNVLKSGLLRGNRAELIIHQIFEPRTCSWQYIVADAASNIAVIIDAVVDFDVTTDTIFTESADVLLDIVIRNGYHVEKLLATHTSEQLLIAAKYLQEKLRVYHHERPPLCVGSALADRQDDCMQDDDSSHDGFEDSETLPIESLQASAVQLPRRSPDSIRYIVGGNDSINYVILACLVLGCVSSKCFCSPTLFNADAKEMQDICTTLHRAFSACRSSIACGQDTATHLRDDKHAADNSNHLQMNVTYHD